MLGDILLGGMKGGVVYEIIHGYREKGNVFYGWWMTLF
jgi:hypothetical protein